MHLEQELAEYHKYEGLRAIAHDKSIEMKWPDHPIFPSHGYVVRRCDLDTMVVENAIKAGASDIHLEEGSPIAVRVNSDIKLSTQVFLENNMTELMSEIICEKDLEIFQNNGDLDASIGIEGLSRIRINAYIANNKRCLTLRILSDHIPKWNELGLPKEFINLSKFSL